MYDPNFPPPVATPDPFAPPPVAVKNTLATVALVCGIASVFTMIFNWVPVQVLSYISCLAPIFGIAALITGILALKFSKKNNGAGRTFAIIGLVLGSVILALFVLIFAVGFLIGFAQAL